MMLSPLPPGLYGFREAQIKTVAGANPAANAEFSVAVPSGVVWKLLGVSVTLVQGAVQTPWPALVLDDGTNVFWEGMSGTEAQAAGSTNQHSWGVGSPASGVAATLVKTGPLPDQAVLPAGYRVRSVTNGLGANSDYAAPILYVVEYT